MASGNMQMTTPWHEKGRMEGKLEGKIEGKIEDAKNMLFLNMDVDIVVKVTGLNREKVKELKVRLKDN